MKKLINQADKAKKIIKYRWTFIIAIIVTVITTTLSLTFREDGQYVLAYVFLAMTAIFVVIMLVFMTAWLVLAVETSGDEPEPEVQVKRSTKHKITSVIVIAGAAATIVLYLSSFIFSESTFPFFWAGQITTVIFFIALIFMPIEVVAKEKNPTVADEPSDLEQQKRDFFSNASHELKTPITSILGFSEMINNNLVSEEEKAATMQRIEKEARRMSALIADILTISRLESRAAISERPTINLTEIVEEAVAAVSPINNGTAITVETNLEQVKYTADPAHMYDLCVNLVENAVKYNKPNGKVAITLAVCEDMVEFTVADTGIGIAPEYERRVFERFYRVDYGRDKRSGGTGLGLSIVKHIAGIYDGKIELDSQLGVGTRILVRLPKEPKEGVSPEEGSQ
ncbi:MAG: ATP-binding protein [Oscillospiraceae bacterium]|nr:ATP-binding protein [Oscillospiraceae bacterium]